MNNANTVFIKKSLLIISMSLIINTTFTVKNISDLPDIKEDTRFGAKHVGHDMKKTAHNVKNDLKSGAHKIKEDAKEGSHNVKEDLQTLAHDVKETFHDVKENIKDKAYHAKENVKQKFTDIKEGLGEKAHNLNEAIKDKLSNIKEEAQEKAESGKESIKLGAHVAEKTIKEKAQHLGEKTKEVASNIKTNVQEKVDSAKEGITKTMSKAQNTIHNVKDDVKERLASQKEPTIAIDKTTVHVVDSPANRKDLKKKIKTFLRASKTKRNALIKKLTDDLINYEILLEKLIAEGLDKAAIEKDPNILILKNAIETTEYEIAFLQEKYNKIWAKAYPNLAKLVYGLSGKFKS